MRVGVLGDPLRQAVGGSVERIKGFELLVAGRAKLFARSADTLLAAGDESFQALMFGVENCPAYTASIDAAKTLVPKGWHVGMLTECDEDDSPSCCLTENEEPCRDAVGRGADMTLSLVAAALRARAGGL